MLDNGTKRRIDNARDILVGKVPDPKAQVEQITTALIYKFMDDMDQEAIALGGKASFFVGEYAKYAWPKVMAKSLSGYDRLALYSEAITKMSQNPNLPQLFRDIFKDAFLPYRDPETLNLFLKEIDGFTYDNSERLGDAFEYLLSVLGSQGAAGQFRTPRHIIDFIVEVVAPTKTDTVLDPACGTAGFLISAYKHILAKNQEKKLSPDEMQRLTKNFVGYDISPEMVRLSLVNMYLHQFQKPTVFEYDTLTSEERWDDSFDIILANPPFMSPKGGIRPHTRFAVQAKRSEVLFVDYIAEHLNPNGRAGVIVPEGIIFQSAKAYKALRKMLIEENYLYAVVSMPAGVFKPYSGVKTSILLMDKTLAKRTDKILFVNIENDGFGLGAQRREIESNDLPKALNIIKDFQSNPNSEPSNSEIAYIIKKSEIDEEGTYNLSAERYKEEVIYDGDWDLVILENVINIDFGKRITKKNNEGTKYPVFGGGGKSFFTDEYNRENEYVISRFAISENCVRYVNEKFFMLDSGFTFSINDEFIKKTIKEYIGEILISIQGRIYKLGRGHAQKNLDVNQFKLLKIPLPPLEVQQAIVDEVEGYQKIIDGARQVVENYRPRIKVDPDWPMVELGEISDITSSKRIFKKEYVQKGIPFYRTKEIVELSENQEISLELFISEERYHEIKTSFGIPHKGDILISAVGTIGISYVIPDNREFYFKDGNLLWVKNISKVTPEYLKLFLDHYFNQHLDRLIYGAAYKALTIINLKKIKVAIPSEKLQNKIIDEIKEEQRIIDATNKLIKIFEKKIEEKIGEVWGEE